MCIKRVFAFVLLSLLLISSVGCRSSKEIDKSSGVPESIVAETERQEKSPSSKNTKTKKKAKNNKTSSSDVSKQTKSSAKSGASQISHILVDNKILSDFSVSVYNYTYLLGDDVKLPPKVTAIQTDGTGTMKITQAKSIGESATVSLNGHTYTIKFTKDDKSIYFNNTYYKLTVKKKLNIAYFGGSVTAGFGSTDASKYSWRAITTNWIKTKFKDASVNETNAAIGGTGTKYGIYRVVSDLKLSNNAQKPDLVFIEFAINDVYDNIDIQTAKSNMEYIIRTIYDYVPDADIFMIFTTDQAQMNKEFSMLQAHKSVAESYRIPYLAVGARLWKDMMNECNGSYPTSTVYGRYFVDTVHPSNNGYAKYASYVTEYLDEAFCKRTAPNGCVNSYKPSSPINTLPVSPYAANLKGKGTVSGINVDSNGFITSSTAGADFTFTFSGTDLKMWYWANPIGGSLSVSIDGGADKTYELYAQDANHKIHTLATGLENKSHTVRITLNNSVRGNSMDIRYFLISGSSNTSGIFLA